jgi:hypothetical protein
MGDLTQKGSEEVAKDQKSVRVRFRRRFADIPHVVVTARLFVRNYEVEWEAQGDAEHAAFGLFRVAAGLGALLALYATMVELRWVPNVLDLLN